MSTQDGMGAAAPLPPDSEPQSQTTSAAQQPAGPVMPAEPPGGVTTPSMKRPGAVVFAVILLSALALNRLIAGAVSLLDRGHLLRDPVPTELWYMFTDAFIYVALAAVMAVAAVMTVMGSGFARILGASTAGAAIYSLATWVPYFVSSLGRELAGEQYVTLSNWNADEWIQLTLALGAAIAGVVVIFLLASSRTEEWFCHKRHVKQLRKSPPPPGGQPT